MCASEGADVESCRVLSFSELSFCNASVVSSGLRARLAGLGGDRLAVSGIEGVEREVGSRDRTLAGESER
jgi:hypothetical protein